MIGKSVSHYKILEKLGEGGMGVVYKAEDTRLKRTVALKFLPPEWTRDPEAKKRFIHEAQAASTLDHSSICTIYEVEETEDGQTFIAMACYEGETLKNRIKRGPLKVEEAVNVAIQIAEGLKEAHDKGIVHRDIKSANIMVTPKGQVKILDFGLARLTGRTRLTKTGTTLGTVDYMSPEQAQGDRIDRRSDIWSLGVVLYEMLTGMKPFAGEYEQAVVYSILNEAPEPITGLRTGISKALEAIVLKCLEKDPSRRYQHADEISVDLKRLVNTVSQTGGRRPPITYKRKRKWAVPVFGFLVVLIAVWMFSTYGPFNRQRAADGTLQKKIVILPFENLGHEEDAYFSHGITEEISSNLATLHNLGVISRQSALHYAGPEFTTEQIGKELGVDFILTGTVRWARVPEGEHRVRITSHLVRAKDDLEVWTQTYEHVLEDVFETQSDIAAKVVDALGLRLNPPHREKFAEKPTENLEAYQAYLRGRYLIGRPHFSEGDWTDAVMNFQKAAEIDTAFALAYAELAKAHARLYYMRYDVSDSRRSLADRAAHTAIRLDPQSAEVRLALGYYYLWAYRNRSRALEEWAIAEKEIPNHVDILIARQIANEPLGLWEESIRITKRAFELSPRNAYLPNRLALFHLVTRKYEQANAYADRAIALEPDAIWPYLYKALIRWSWKGADDVSRAALTASSWGMDHEFYLWFWYFQHVGERHFQDAFDLIQRFPGEWSKHKMSAMPKAMMAGFIYRFQDEEEKARQCFEESIPLLRAALSAYPDDPRYHSSLGIALAGIGKNEEALREGKRAVELLPLSKDKAYGTSYVADLAVIYAMTGNVDAACEQLEILLNIDSWFSPNFMRIDIRIATLYGEPQFESLMKKYEVTD